MKIINLIILLLILLPKLLWADVIYSPNTKHDAALCVEFIGSYEYTFTNYKTINFWGGIGAASSITVPEYPAVEAEIAVEMRHYFGMYKYEGLCLALYYSVGLLRHPTKYRGVKGIEYSAGFHPGFYLAYKKYYSQKLIIEPYLGISRTMYATDFNDLFKSTVDVTNRMMFNLGVRIGLNKTSK